MRGKSLIMMSGLLIVLATAVSANAVHAPRGASGQGHYDSSYNDCLNGQAPFANGFNSCVAFEKLNLIVSGTTFAADLFTYRNNPDDGTSATYDVFRLPVAIENGTRIRMTFATPDVHGAFFCDNGSALYAVDYPDDPHPIPLVGLPCAQGDVPLNPNAFFTEIDSGNSATLTFNSRALAVSGWTFYTVPGNLTGFEVLP